MVLVRSGWKFFYVQPKTHELRDSFSSFRIWCTLSTLSSQSILNSGTLATDPFSISEAEGLWFESFEGLFLLMEVLCPSIRAWFEWLSLCFCINDWWCSHGFSTLWKWKNACSFWLACQVLSDLSDFLDLCFSQISRHFERAFGLLSFWSLDSFWLTSRRSGREVLLL